MEIIDKAKIGETFEIIRQNQQLSRTELIKDICNKSTYSTIENGNTDVTLSRFIKLVNRLDIDFNEFMFIANDYQTGEKKSIIKKFLEGYSSENSTLKEEAEKEALEEYFKTNALQFRHLYLFIKAYNGKLSENEQTEIEKYLMGLEIYTMSNFNLFHNFAYHIKPKVVYKLAEKIVPQYLKYKDFKNTTISYWGLILNVIDVAITNRDVQLAYEYLDLAKEEMKNTMDTRSKLFLLEHEARLLMLQEETYHLGIELSQKIISSLDLLGEYKMLEEFQEEINQLRKE